MKYFDAFAGIGGFALGIQRATNALEQRRCGQAKGQSETIMPDVISQPDERQHATCVGFSEIDKYASSVYQRHFGGHKPYGDITAIRTTDIPDFDILVGGFPCQSFSIAGKRAGFEDTRGTLFFELARILADKKPGYFCFENVKGLLSHDRGRTFKTIIATLDELGYDLQWQVLNSKHFGVPQNRERIFIIGNLRDRPRPQVFPIRESNQEDIALPTITTRVTSHSNGSYVRMGQTQKRVNDIKVAGTLDEGGWEKRHESSRRVYDPDGLAPTIPTGTGGGVMPKIANGSRIRRLTPLECERLQAFPDDWTKFGRDGELISDSQRYKMCGNAVTVNVIEAIFTQLFSSILQEQKCTKK